MKTNNELIAEFMPNMMKAESTMDMGIEQWLDDDGEYYLPEELRYHESWDWLMPVVEKCLQVLGDSKESEQFYQGIHDALWDINIKTTHEAVVQFIKWYNQQRED
jgi:hypothetical protein